MRLSKRTEYGVRAIIQLAGLSPSQFVQARDISKREGMPTKFLEAILNALKRANFLESKVGSGGGYRLSRDPREIRLGDVIRRLEERLSTRDGEVSSDRSAGELAVNLINKRLTGATDNALDEITLAALLEDVNSRSQGGDEMYYI